MDLKYIPSIGIGLIGMIILFSGLEFTETDFHLVIITEIGGCILLIIAFMSYMHIDLSERIKKLES